MGTVPMGAMIKAIKIFQLPSIQVIVAIRVAGTETIAAIKALIQVTTMAMMTKKMKRMIVIAVLAVVAVVDEEAWTAQVMSWHLNNLLMHRDIATIILLLVFKRVL